MRCGFLGASTDLAPFIPAAIEEAWYRAACDCADSPPEERCDEACVFCAAVLRRAAA